MRSREVRLCRNWSRPLPPAPSAVPCSASNDPVVMLTVLMDSAGGTLDHMVRQPDIDIGRAIHTGIVVVTSGAVDVGRHRASGCGTNAVLKRGRSSSRNEVDQALKIAVGSERKISDCSRRYFRTDIRFVGLQSCYLTLYSTCANVCRSTNGASSTTVRTALVVRSGKLLPVCVVSEKATRLLSSIVAIIRQFGNCGTD